mmetsp:Transcript_26654/g.74515  ORF Transcript_26654/g.74515 Transcript_26654/m.74515 type:complete len:248 (+) Transcript_26654:318-1061(+)
MVCRQPHTTLATGWPARSLTSCGLFTSALEPRPSCPNWFQPQAKSWPRGPMAMVCLQPPLALWTPARACSRTGVRRCSLSPVPSCPYLFQPNTNTSPSPAMHTLCLHPQHTWETSRTPWTWQGTLRSSHEPKPRLPYRPQPQAKARPSALQATVCSAPQATPRTLTPASASTAAGTLTSSLWPSPSWPFWLRPQQSRASACVTIMVWVSPQATARTGTPLRARTRRGRNRSSLLPCPRRPKSPQPHE